MVILTARGAQPKSDPSTAARHTDNTTSAACLSEHTGQFCCLSLDIKIMRVEWYLISSDAGLRHVTQNILDSSTCLSLVVKYDDD